MIFFFGDLMFIIGQEYRVAIIGTSEPTREDGLPLSLTDSICVPHVFNTVVSRARSYVVVVGDPLVLLTKEIHMMEKFGSSTGGFWSSYLRLCLEHGTFKSDHLEKRSPQSYNLCMKALLSLLKSDNQVTVIIIN